MKKNRYPLEIIRNALPQDELLCQLAEEAAELAQAALKLRRAYTGINPTPVTAQEAFEGLLEEKADVQTCIAALGFDRCIDEMRVARIQTQKMERWAERLKGAGNVETD